MTWWWRARWLTVGLSLFVVSWSAALLCAEQVVPFATFMGPRAPVPVPYLIGAMGLIGLVYGLDRSRSALESTAVRSIGARDAALMGSAALVCAGVAGVAAALAVPDATGTARVMIAGLGAYLVMRVVVRPDLAALTPLGLLTLTIVGWDASTGAGLWLMAEPDDVGAWVLTVVLFLAGLCPLAWPPRGRFRAPGA